MSQSKNKIGRGPSYCHLQAFCSFCFGNMGFFSARNMGLYNWNYDYRRLLNIILGLGFLVPAVTLILWLLRNKLSHTWLNVGKWVLNIVSVAVIIVSFGIVFT